LTILLVRYWGAEYLGKFSFILAFTELFVYFGELGLSFLLIREIAKNKSAVDRYINNAFAVGSIFSIFAFALMIVIAKAMRLSSDILLGIYIGGLYLIIGIFTGFFKGAFHAYQKMEYETIMAFIEKGTILAGGVFVIGYTQSLIALIFIFLIGGIINFLVGWFIYVHKISRVRFEFDFRFLGYLIKGSIPFGLNLFLTSIYYQIDVILLSSMRSSEEVGWYRAVSIIGIYLPIIATSLSSALFPVMSEFFGKASKESLITAFNKSARYLLIFTIPIPIVTIFLADKFILLLYGKEFINSIIVLQILIWVIPIRFVNDIQGVLLTSIDRQTFRTLSIAITVGIFLALSLFLIPLYGCVGVSIAIVLSESIMFILRHIYICKCLHTLPIYKLIKKAVLSSIIMGIIVYSLKNVNLFVLIPVATTIYFTLLSLLGDFSRDDIDLLKRIFRNPKEI